MHGFQSHIESTLDWPCCAAHYIDGNAILQSIIALPVTFMDLMEPVFKQALKAEHVGFVCFVLFDSLRPIKIVQLNRDVSSWVEPVQR